MKTNYKFQLIIAGMGNYLMGDDGAGVHLIQKLKTKKLSEEILLVEAGISPFNYLTEISQSKKIIAVDALRGGQKPGTIYKFALEDIRRDRNLNSHGMSLIDIIEISRTLYGYPLSTTFFGIEPASIKLESSLSPPVEKAVLKLAHIISKKYI